MLDDHRSWRTISVTHLPVPPTRTDHPALIDIRAVAKLLGCSPRHVNRLAEAGAMPAPLRLGALVRWSAQTVQEWIEAGCPRVSATAADFSGRESSESREERSEPQARMS
jgi:excisionase family DNA binding protein